MEYGKSKLIRLLENTPREGWTNQKLKDLIDSLWRDPVLLRWSGFENAGGPDTLISWNATDKIFSIAPLVVTFGFYQYRVKLSFHKRAVIESINMSEILAEGRYIFFYTYNEELLKHVVSFIHNPTETEVNEIFLYKTEIANIYWDADAGEAIHFGDDRHGSEWNPQIHRYLHTAFRARRKSGLTITGASFGGDGSDNAHAKFSVIGGVMLHDDFELEIPSSSDSIPILYQQGFFPRYVYNSGYAIYKGAARACFNTGGAIVQADNGNYILYHIFATNEIGTASRKIISVMGSAEYTTLADAYTAAPAELDALNTWMPQQGRFHIDTIVVQTSDDFTNDAASIIVSIAAKTHPPVSIADNSKQLLEITDKQELSIPGDFEADEFYAIKNRVWQKMTAGGGGTYKWNLHGPEQIIGNLANPGNIVADADGTGAVDTTIPVGTYAIVAINAAGETLPVDVPEIVILEDTSAVVVSWDAVEGATGYRVYEVSTGLYYDLTSNVWLYFTQVPATAGMLPTENTALVYQNSFAINNDDTVEITGEGIDVETEVDELDSTIKRILLKKQQSSWSEENPESPNFIPGKPESLDGREIELSTSEGYIVWRYVGEETWNNLIEIAVLVGDDGREVELRENAGWVEWRYVGDATWTQLFEIHSGGGASVIQVTGLTLAAANWVADGALFKYVLSNVNITATSSVEVIPDNTSYDVLVVAEPRPGTASASGTVSMWVKNIPTADIPVTINITEVV